MEKQQNTVYDQQSSIIGDNINEQANNSTQNEIINQNFGKYSRQFKEF